MSCWIGTFPCSFSRKHLMTWCVLAHEGVSCRLGDGSAELEVVDLWGAWGLWCAALLYLMLSLLKSALQMNGLHNFCMLLVEVTKFNDRFHLVSEIAWSKGINKFEQLVLKCCVVEFEWQCSALIQDRGRSLWSNAWMANLLLNLPLCEQHIDRATLQGQQDFMLCLPRLESDSLNEIMTLTACLQPREKYRW